MQAKSLTNSWITTDKKLPFEHASEYLPEPLEPQNSSGVKISLVPEGAFSGRGTGSRWSEAMAELSQHAILVNIGNAWPVLVLGTNLDKSLSPTTVGEKLTTIRDTFGLSAAALATILRASRASVYNWLENEIPSDNFLQRIDQLSTIAADWKEMNPFHFSPGRLMKQKLGDGITMLERLSRKKLDLTVIQSGMQDLLMLMKKHKERMDKAKIRASKVTDDIEGHREILERATGSITTDR
jgi:DNA-binding transcriptional regulator YiaG